MPNQYKTKKRRRRTIKPKLKTDYDIIMHCKLHFDPDDYSQQEFHEKTRVIDKIMRKYPPLKRTNIRQFSKKEIKQIIKKNTRKNTQKKLKS